MQVQFTRLAQRVIRRARAETERLGVSNWGADSLLLGLLGERRCLANRALAALDLDLPRARQELETRATHAAYRQNRACPAIVSPILLRALEETKAHGQPCCNTAHLLLGILHDGTSAAVQILAAHGLAADAVRQALADAARQGAAAEGGRAIEAPGPVDLFRQFRDPSAHIRLESVLRLSGAVTLKGDDLGVPAAELVAVLSELLHDPDEMVRTMAARVLGQLGPAARSAVPALHAALTDRTRVRAAAAEALAIIEAPDAEVAERRVRGLEDASAKVRVASAKALWAATQDAGRVLPVLRAALTGTDAEARPLAASALGELGPAAQDAVPALIAALQDPQQLVRMATLTALCRVGAPARAAVPALIALARDPNELISVSAGGALVVLAKHGPEFVPDLQTALADPDPRVRMYAAGALGLLGSAAAPAIPALHQALGDSAALVRCAAAGSLWQLEQREGLVAVLVELLAGADVRAAGLAARLMALMRTAAPEVIAPLQAALERDAVQVRIAAAFALIQLDQPPDHLLPLLAAGLAAPDMSVRFETLSSLVQLGPRANPVVPALVEAYHQSEGYWHHEVEKALQKIEPAICLHADEPTLVPTAPGPTGSGAAPVQEARSLAAEALADWSEAIRFDAEDIQAFRCRGEVFEQRKDWPSACADWTEAIRLAPEEVRAYMHRGRALLEMGQWDRAAADFTFAIQQQPRNANAYNCRAIVDKRKGNFRPAFADYTEAIRLNPRRAGFLRNRSVVAKAMKDYGQAMADLAAALALDPEHAAAHNDLACLRATCPDPGYRDGAQAVTSARRACELSAWGSAVFLHTLAAAYAEAGQFDEAVRWAKKALAHPEQLTAAQVKDFTAHLGLFEQGRPFHEN